ncbi:MAG TPA: hypothetical protein VLJ86_03785 [Ramlibacter sp.]|nr:hypothetical protein [Ramlibacter sp.]
MFLQGGFFRDPRLPLALAAGLLLALPGAAQPAGEFKTVKAASTDFSVRLTVRPAFRILNVRPVAGGLEYRVWTNMKSIHLNGREYRFQRVGENTLVVPSLVAGPAPQPLLYGLARVRPEVGRETVTVSVDY